MSLTISASDIGRHPAFVGSMLCLCFIAVVLNLIVIIAVLKYGRYRTSIDILVTNLASSDLLIAGIVNPLDLKSTASYNEDFYGNDTVCKIIMFIPLLSVMSAILTIVALAIDRYRTIVLQKRIYRRGAITAIACIWITSFIISAPQLYEYNVYVVTDNEVQNNTFKSCGSIGTVDNYGTVYALSVFFLAFLGPLVILTACYTKLIFYVYMHGRRFRKTRMTNTILLRKQPSDRINDMLSARMIKVLKMLLCITATFVLLWTPYFVIFGMTEITGIDDTSKFVEWPHVVGHVMTVFSTISNPVLYLAFSETFRTAILNAWNDLLSRPLRPGQSGLMNRSNRVQPITPKEVSNINLVGIQVIALNQYKYFKHEKSEIVIS